MGCHGASQLPVLSAHSLSLKFWGTVAGTLVIRAQRPCFSKKERWRM